MAGLKPFTLALVLALAIVSVILAVAGLILTEYRQTLFTAAALVLVPIFVAFAGRAQQ